MPSAAPPPSAAAPPPPERELPLIQRGIVDTCFEEGHYEYGIAVLDRLRAPRYKPFPLHVRQLLFIALYPPPPAHARRPAPAAPPPSPHRLQLQRQKDALWPTPAARPLAVALLHALADTNTPASLLRAVPHHGAPPADDAAEDISPLRHEVRAMQQLKDCWGMLRAGFVARKQGDRARAAAADDDDAAVPAAVGPYAWPVLEWLVRVFEKDERDAAAHGAAPHSALLACQIPAPRARGPRWDAETPVAVAFACFRADDPAPPPFEKRCDLGARLILLLVNLTATKPPQLAPAHLLRTLLQHLPDLALPALEALLALLPPSHAPFKRALLEGFLAHAQHGAAAAAPPPPKARAKPKFTGRGAAAAAAAAPDAAAPARAPLPAAPTDATLALLAAPLPAAAAPTVACAKYQLVATLWVLRAAHAGVRAAVCAGFAVAEGGGGGGEGAAVAEYRALALEVVGLWEASG